MEDHQNQLYFLIKMHNVRGIYKEIPKEVFQYLKQIFSFILDLFNIDNISDEELQIVREIIILSETFYKTKYIIIKKKKIYI